MVLSTGVGASVALAKLKEMREVMRKAAAHRNGVTAAERALRFSFAAFDALPEEEQKAHSWQNCTACSRDVVACRLLGIDVCTDTAGPAPGEHLCVLVLPPLSPCRTRYIYACLSAATYCCAVAYCLRFWYMSISLGLSLCLALYVAAESSKSNKGPDMSTPRTAQLPARDNTGAY